MASIAVELPSENPSGEVASREPVERVIGRVRFGAFRVIRLFATVFLLPAVTFGLAQSVANGSLGVRIVAMWSAVGAAIVSAWAVGERNHRRGAAAFVTLIWVVLLLGVPALGLTPGLSAGLGLACLCASVFFGTAAGVVSFLGVVALLTAEVAWVHTFGPRPSALPGAQVLEAPVLLRYALALLGVIGMMLSLVSAVVRGLEESTVALARALGRERAERDARLMGERELARARSLEALGRLAGGVAHDTSNALVALEAGLGELRGQPLPADHAEVLDDMSRALMAAKETMRQLRALGGKPPDGQGKPAPILASQVVDQFARGIRRLVPAEVQIRFQGPAVGPIQADAALLEQALLNLCFNARDAMPAGGHIDLRVAEEVRAGLAWVAIEVRDDGPGLPPEILRHLFEPGHTTKPDKGSGLGLSMVHRFATSSGGKVEVESRPGDGTTFRLLLPLHQQGHEAA